VFKLTIGTFLLSPPLTPNLIMKILPSATFLLCISSAVAWSPQSAAKSNAYEAFVAAGQGSVSRRRWIQQSAAAALVATTTIVQPAFATADSTGIYIPPPDSMRGKTVLITGGNTGLGLESAKRLAAAGARVIVTTRTADKGASAVRDIQAYANNGPTPIALVLDLCDLAQVKQFASNQLKSVLDGAKLDVLINNAGVMAIPDRQLTNDGFERTFQTNHLGHFVLTSTLANMLAQNARIINVSSEAYQFAPKGLELDNLQGEREYSAWGSYGLSKLENILFTKELQRRAPQWTVVALHPGAVATDLGRYLVGEEKWNRMKTQGMTLQEKLLFVPLSKLTKTVEQGASTQVFAAVDLSVQSAKGMYFMDCKPKVLKGAPDDEEAAKQLWEVSEKLSGIAFQL
jgi:NAD(P)-dependent dehydrogenase (short-subunit alcohol dehydrogenase family)